MTIGKRMILEQGGERGQAGPTQKGGGETPLRHCGSGGGEGIPSTSLCRNSSRASIIFNRIRCREFHALWWADGPWALRAGFRFQQLRWLRSCYSVQDDRTD